MLDKDINPFDFEYNLLEKPKAPPITKIIVLFSWVLIFINSLLRKIIVYEKYHYN